MKKVLMILLALAMVFSMAGVVSADDTTDITGDSGNTEVTYNTEQGYIVTIPTKVAFVEGSLESANSVKATNVLLPSGALLDVTVSSPNEFNLVCGSGLTVSKIPYTVTKYDGKVAVNGDSVLQVASGVTENSADLTFSTTEENVKQATLSGEHKDTLAFSVEVKGGSTSGDTQEPSVIYIGNKAQLLAFAADVNGGNAYAGKTVKLTADIDLNGEEWTPIGPNADAANKFKGTFDGQGHTISNLNVDTEADYTAAGFFGALNGVAKNFVIDGATIKHISTGDPTDNGIAVVAGSLYPFGTIDGVTVKNAVVEGNRYVGGISGYTYGNVKNCKVIDSEITAVPDNKGGSYNNGDKVGGIAGYWSSESTYSMTGNTVENVVLKAYRDVGGIAGTATSSGLTGNKVKDVFIIVDQDTNHYADKDANADEIFGPRVDTTPADPSNTYEDVYIWINGELQGGPIEEVGTPVALKALSMDVGLGNDYEGKTITLTEDIDLSGVTTNGDSFAPIGHTGEKDSNGKYIFEPFKGTFDGDGHTISNLYQSGWDFNYDWYNYGSIGLFSKLESATVKNVVLDGFECQIEGGDISFIAGSATGDCTFEDIEIKNGKIGTYNNGIGGIIGWSGAGSYTFNDITIREDVVLGGLWGSFDSSVGGIVGQAEPGATYNFKNVDIACRLDVYNDCTASYDYYNYRMCGMIIGRLEETTNIDGKNYPDTSKYSITCTDVTVTYGEWANYHYCEPTPGLNGGRGMRVEAGYAYDGLPADFDHTQCTTNHMACIPFDQIFGGDQLGVKGLKEYAGVTIVYPEEYTCPLCDIPHNTS